MRGSGGLGAGKLPSAPDPDILTRSPKRQIPLGLHNGTLIITYTILGAPYYCNWSIPDLKVLIIQAPN